MIKKLLIIGLYSIVLHAQGQSRADSVNLLEHIAVLENQGYQFFYKEDWLKGITTAQPNVARDDLPSYLRALFATTSISFHQEGEHIILTDNTPIITEPAIASFLDETVDQELITSGYVFSREYDANSERPEDKTYEVGSRNLFTQGGETTIAGYITETDSGNPVEGALVYIQSPFIGTSSSADGFYSITLPSGRQTLQLQSLNMKNTYREVIALSDGRLDVAMDIDVIALNAVTVSADREFNVKSTQMGLTKINKENIKIVPAILGEADIIRVATTTSGVQNLGEGAAGINIRGGKADQNLFLLDGAPVYNTNHFFGFFSVFNAAAIEGMELYKSGIPANYGGRLSSVFDIATKVPNKEKFSASGGLGVVTSRLMVETPIGKNGPSVMVSGRATYSDFVIDQISNSALANQDVSFYDVLAKVHHRWENNDEFSVTAYRSFDRFKLSADTLLSFSDYSYTNEVFTANWRHVFNEALQADFRVSHSRYQYEIKYDELASQAFTVDYGLRETSAMANFDWSMGERLNHNFGIESKHFSIQPGEKRPAGQASIVLPDDLEEEQGLESAAFFSTQYNVSEDLSLQGGLRYSFFQALGPGTGFVYGDRGPRSATNRVAEVSYENNEVRATYHGPELRLSGRYSLNETSSIKLSYNRTRQYIHLLLNAASIAPTDNWRISNEHIAPQVADQISLGYYKNYYGKNTIETSAEVYYKDISNLVDFKVGADLQFNKAIETSILQGPGRAYGVELSVKKNNGWWTGWINYTYSRSLIQLDGDFPEEVINGGSYFPTAYDKPHYLNSITNYKFSRRLSMTLNVVYATGVPVTYPVGKWRFKNSENILYSDRNAFRIPDYFRMDLGVNIEGTHKIKKLAHSSWTFSVYNLLGRDNVYSVFFNLDGEFVQGNKLLVFKDPIPTLTYNFSF
ncbi:MAG: carboxypeptidase-like regulatory domain-containing protein [Bacteroidota bacterium]